MMGRFANHLAGFVPAAVARRLSPPPHPVDDVPLHHTATVDLLVLAFSVCSATPVDCLRLGELLNERERQALKTLVETAARAGLMGKGLTSPVEQAKAFLSCASE